MKTTLRILFVFALFGLLLAMPGARDGSDPDAETTATEKGADSQQDDRDENAPKAAETGKNAVKNAKNEENTKGNSKAKEPQGSPLQMLKPLLEMPGTIIGGAASMVNGMIGGVLDGFEKGLGGKQAEINNN